MGGGQIPETMKLFHTTNCAGDEPHGLTDEEIANANAPNMKPIAEIAKHFFDPESQSDESPEETEASTEVEQGEEQSEETPEETPEQ